MVSNRTNAERDELLSNWESDVVCFSSLAEQSVASGIYKVTRLGPFQCNKKVSLTHSSMSSIQLGIPQTSSFVLSCLPAKMACSAFEQTHAPLAFADHTFVATPDVHRKFFPRTVSSPDSVFTYLSLRPTDASDPYMITACCTDQFIETLVSENDQTSSSVSGLTLPNHEVGSVLVSRIGLFTTSCEENNRLVQASFVFAVDEQEASLVFRDRESPITSLRGLDGRIQLVYTCQTPTELLFVLHHFCLDDTNSAPPSLVSFRIPWSHQHFHHLHNLQRIIFGLTGALHMEMKNCYDAHDERLFVPLGKWAFALGSCSGFTVPPFEFSRVPLGCVCESSTTRTLLSLTPRTTRKYTDEELKNLLSFFSKYLYTLAVSSRRLISVYVM